MTEDNPEITFGESFAETLLEEIGWGVDDEGYIVNDGERITSFYVEGEVHIDEFCGIFEDDEGDKQVIKDNFVELVEMVKKEL